MVSERIRGISAGDIEGLNRSVYVFNVKVALFQEETAKRLGL